MKADMRHILITGATGAIGSALARYLAAPERTLILQGRDAEVLERVAQACRQAGAQVVVVALDLCDRTALTDWLNQLLVDEAPDLVIANAGMNAHGASG